MKKILICGDSFASDWTVKYSGTGWPNMLANDYNVTNSAQAGCSEYKIYLQLLNADISKYDAVIVSHTSPNRIYVKRHPVHYNDVLHKHSDLLYTDIAEHVKQNKSLRPILDYYENYFDLDHAKFTHNLICKEIEQHLDKFGIPVLHITNIDWTSLYTFKSTINFFSLFEKQRGLINHYNDAGNIAIYQTVKDFISQA
jgi:hypothetical protein